MKSFCSDVPALLHTGDVRPGDLIVLDQEEARHARALRLREGDPIVLLDGRGRRSRGLLEHIQKRSTTVKVLDTVLEEPDPGLYIGLAVGVLADRSRMEWLVEKSVELGVREIFPVRSKRTEGFSKAERLQRVAIAALKQCQRSRLPEIHEELPWDEVVRAGIAYDAVALFHEQETAKEDFRSFLENLAEKKRVLLMVGPEGGFTEEEVQMVRAEANSHVVSLGPTRFRAETAAVVALGTLATVLP